MKCRKYESQLKIILKLSLNFGKNDALQEIGRFLGILTFIFYTYFFYFNFII